MDSALLEAVRSAGGRWLEWQRDSVPREGLPELGFHGVGVRQGRTRKQRQAGQRQGGAVGRLESLG